AKELLDDVMPGNLVGYGRQIVHAIDDRDVLVVIQILAELFKAAVQVANVRDRLDNGLAIERQEEAQRRVRGRVLRPEVERPQIFLVGRSLEGADFDGFQRHIRPPDCRLQISNLQSAIYNLQFFSSPSS